MSYFDKGMYWVRRRAGLRGQGEVPGTRRYNKEFTKVLRNPDKYKEFIRESKKRQSAEKNTPDPARIPGLQEGVQSVQPVPADSSHAQGSGNVEATADFT